MDQIPVKDQVSGLNDEATEEWAASVIGTIDDEATEEPAVQIGGSFWSSLVATP